MSLVEIGKELIMKGYEIVPLKENDKRPTESAWTTKDYNLAWFDKASVNGSANCGVGVKAKHTPGVDIDTTNEKIQNAMFDFLWDNFGADMIRWGRRPLVMFKTSIPFKKMSSKKYFDANGEKHQLEILGDGQQYVLSGIHPDTLKEYTTNGEILAKESLSELTASDCEAIIAHFEMLAKQVDGWVESGVGHKSNNNTPALTKLPLNLADWQVEEHINRCGYVVEDYDEWLRMGMALYHQYSGSNEGLIIWDGWSQRGSNYNANIMAMKWESFSGDAGGITFRSIVKASNDNTKVESQAVKLSVLEQIKACTDEHVLLDELLPSFRGEVVDTELEIAAQEARKVYKTLAGYALAIKVFRDALTPPVSADARDFSWCEQWYFLKSPNYVYDTREDSIISGRAFNTMFANRTEPGEGSPLDFAVSNELIPTVYDVMYMPTEQGSFFLKGKEYYNMYRENPLSGSVNQEAIDIFKSHCEQIIPDTRDRHLFINFLRHTVEYPGDRVNWAVLLQGPEGNGKSFFEVMLREILGRENVNTVSNTLIKSDFNEWAYGAVLNVLSELKITGQNRYTLYNNIKPYITDKEISLNIKGLRVRTVINTANYLITTNYKDAAPIDDNDRRLFVLFTTPDIQETSYYDRLFDICKVNPYSIKEYLLSVEYHPDFEAKGRAPVTEHRGVMSSYNKDPIAILIDEAVEDDDDVLINGDYVSVTSIRLMLEAEGFGKYTPNRVSNILHNLGYEHVCRVQHNGDRHNFWSKKSGVSSKFIRENIKSGEI